MTRILIGQFLMNAGACSEAITWADPFAMDYEKAWVECKEPLWMRWFLGRTDCDRPTIVRIAASIAREVLPIFEAKRPGDDRPRKAIEAAEAWAANPSEAARLECERARSAPSAYAAYDAAAAAYADATYAAYAASSAYAATYAAYAASSAYAAASAATYAAYAAYDAAAAAYADARSRMLSRCADIVREHTAGRTFGWKR